MATNEGPEQHSHTGPDDQVDPRSVAIIGGGIAGITAAIKLLNQGYHVTLFEKEEVLGGNLSSNSKDNHKETWEVYPHIFGDWYEEFWGLLKDDFNIIRDDEFKRVDDVRMALVPHDLTTITGFKDVTFAKFSTPTSLTNLVNNCFSDILPIRESFLFGYTYLDLVTSPATSARTSKVLNDLDVAGFLYSRPYMSNDIAVFHDDILKLIWSMPSDSTSAKAYRKLIRHTLTFPRETPFAWFLKGPLKATLLDTIERKLREKLSGRGKLETSSEVVSVVLDQRKVGGKWLDEHVYVKVKDQRPKKFRYAIIATPAKVAGRLALGTGGTDRLVARQPNLARLREARTARIPVVYLYFTEDFRRKHEHDLKHLPKELTGFKTMPADTEPSAERTGEPARASDLAKMFYPGTVMPEVGYDISIHNIASVWKPDYVKDVLKAHGGEPVLVLAASRASAIKQVGVDETQADDGTRQGWAMIARLHGYLPFIKPGRYWGDYGKDDHGNQIHEVSVDWSRTRVINNNEHQLFLNDTESNEWRPKVKLENAKGELLCKNVFFAGDYCMTDVDMATVEAAVQSGVLAAQALQWENKDEISIPPGKGIRMRPHTVYAPEALLSAKLFWMPGAFLAGVSAIHDEASRSPALAIKFPLTVADLAASYWSDGLRTAIQLGSHLIPGSDEQNPGPAGYSGRHDRKIGIPGMLVNVGRALVVEGPRVGPKLKFEATELAYGAWRATVGRAFFPDMPKTFHDPSRRPPRVYRRDPDAPPETWSDLVDVALGDTHDTAGRLSNLAFGKAAGSVRFVQSLPKVDKPGSLSAQLRAAIKEGVAAYRRREDAD